MYWIKESDKTGRAHDLLLFSLIVLSVITIAVNRPLVSLVVGFIGAYMLLIRLYDKRLGNKLTLENTRRSIRMFEGEEAELEIVMKNQSFLPIFNGHLSFTTDKKVDSERFVRFTRKRKNYFHVPLLLMGKGEARIPISLKALERGVVRLEEIQFSFPHIMNFEQVYLKYKTFYQTDILVYPRLSPVGGIEEFPYNNFGNQVTQFSL